MNHAKVVNLAQEKVKVKVTSDSFRPHGLQSMEFSRTEYWSGQLFPSPGIEPRSSALQADSLPAQPPWKPKNIGVGSLSLLQRIFPVQELNQGLLHCRWILYQLSYQESPFYLVQGSYRIEKSFSMFGHVRGKLWSGGGSNSADCLEGMSKAKLDKLDVQFLYN